jgi:drug/metabolite transporter (DMT)-like permease
MKIAASVRYAPRFMVREMALPAFRPHLPAAALLLACAIWGTSFLFGKIALRVMTVSQLLLLRFSLGSLALLPILVIRRARVRRGDLPLLLLTGFLAVPLTFLLQFHGLALTTISRASLIIGAGPPCMALGGMLFFGERAGRQVWMAILASMAGILAISGSPAGAGSWVGDALVFVSILVSITWVLMTKRISDRLGALTTTVYLMLFGTLTLAPFTLLGDGFPSLDFPGEVWLSILVLGLACTALAFVLWNWGLERFTASRAGLFLNIEPAVGVLLGVALMHESLGPGVILGGVLVLGAAIFVGRADAPTPVNEGLPPGD